MATWTQRMIGAARLDAATYEEVEADRGANRQAMGVVLLSSVAGGVGAIGEAGLFGFVKVASAALVAWLVWAFLTWFVGTKLLPSAETKADIGELLRTIGFAASPGILRVLSGVPVVGPIVELVASFWMLAAMVVAVRQALDYKGTGRAVAVCLLGFLVYVGILVGTALFFGLGAFMLGSILAR
jgi:hypothetical protein